MADEFDRFLASSLAPAERLPDRSFVTAVRARIILDDRLARERRSVIGNFVTQIVALLAVAAALWVLGRAAPVAEWFAQSSALGLAMLLLAFAAIVGLFIRTSSGGAVHAEL